MVKILKRYYGRFYDNEDIKVFVRSGDITVDDYSDITGETYEEEGAE